MAGRKSHDMGLGSLRLVGLREARERALQQRRLLRLEGIDPIAKRRADRQAAMIEAASVMTFKDALKPTSPHTKQAGKTRSMPHNGRAHCRPTSIRSLVTYPSRRSMSAS